jgi:hypothetical protein
LGGIDELGRLYFGPYGLQLKSNVNEIEIPPNHYMILEWRLMYGNTDRRTFPILYNNLFRNHGRNVGWSELTHQADMSKVDWSRRGNFLERDVSENTINFFNGRKNGDAYDGYVWHEVIHNKRKDGRKIMWNKDMQTDPPTYNDEEEYLSWSILQGISHDFFDFYRLWAYWWLYKDSPEENDEENDEEKDGE